MYRNAIHCCLLGLGIVSLCGTTSPLYGAGTQFEDLPLGSQIMPPFGSVPWSFITGDVMIEAEDFYWFSGISTSMGIATVEAGGLAGGSGQELQVNNINLDFHMGPTTELTLRYGEYGGNLNIDINGDFRNFHDLSSIAGSIIGGVQVNVIPGSIPEQGILHLKGSSPGAIHSFQFGGQELWIDDLEYEPMCVDKATPDLNGDGAIDAADAAILFAAWTGDGVPTHSVPEPAAGLAMLAAIPWFVVRRVTLRRKWRQ